MNAGLANLTTLKSWLLPSGMVAGTDYDAQILAIGRGVALQIETFCNRKLTRLVDDVYEISADRAHLYLPRLPVESIAAIELSDSKDDAWQDIAANVQQQDLAKGYLEFLQDQGLWYSRMRVRYTGGYWFNPSEARVQDDTVDLDAGAESIDIVFPEAFEADPRILLTLQVPADGTIITVVPSAITPQGFTALIGAPIPATGYALTWEAKSSGANTTLEDATLQDGVVDLDEDAESLEVEFPLAFAAAPRVHLTLQVPEDGTIISVVPSAVTAQGFIALIGFPIPASGYKLVWEAKSTAADAMPTTQPAGATAVPDDLLIAWRLQCEWIWTKRDKLGLSIGEKQDNVFAGSLAKVVLLDGVKEQLRPYIRYAMT